jgi:hypothetical protein
MKNEEIFWELGSIIKGGVSHPQDLWKSKLSRRVEPLGSISTFPLLRGAGTLGQD